MINHTSQMLYTVLVAHTQLVLSATGTIVEQSVVKVCSAPKPSSATNM